MDLYSETLPPFSNQSAGGDPDCSAARCVPAPGVALTIISSVASIIGSLLIICTFLRWKDLRTIARMILVFLAISDLLAGIGYVFGAAIYIHYYYINGYCDDKNSSNFSAINPANITTYQHLCTIQSFVTTLMPVTSFLWTGNLAIYLFVSIVWPKIKITKILMILFHVTAWGIPLVTCVAILATGYFGSSQSRSSGGWCWIKYKDHGHQGDYYAAESMAGKVWEIGVCVLALFVCIAIKVIMARRFRKSKGTTKVGTETEYSSISIEKQLHAAYTKLDQKLIWLPIAFLLLRMWGNIRFFISFCDSSRNSRCCEALYNPFLVYMQSVCDPGQGWSNALLFVIFNQKILHRLCPCLQPCLDSCRRCLQRCGRSVWRSRSKKKRTARVVHHQNIVVAEGTSGTEVTDREPLLSTSLQSSSNLSTSVLYSSGTTTIAGDEHRTQTQSKPKSPSINSKY